MDLSKVQKFKHQINLDISDSDVKQILTLRGSIASKHFSDSKACFDIFPSCDSHLTNFRIGHITKDDDRRFFEFSAWLSNGMVIQKTFWNFEVIPLLSFKEMDSWEKPRKIAIKLNIGVYDGDGTANEWQNILTKLDDFTPICLDQTSHSAHMEELLNSGRFADIQLRCINDQDLPVHKCILASSSPYFRALFCGDIQQTTNIINVNFDYGVVKAVMGYIYSGRLCEKMVESWPNLFLMARHYNLDLLANHSELQMMSKTPNDLDSIKKLLKFAITYQAYDLKHYTIKKIRKAQETQECRKYRGVYSLFIN